MKEKIIKICLSFLFVFGIFILTNKCFCATGKVYFEKPDSWTGTNVYANLKESSTGNLLIAEPGYKIEKQMSKFSIDKLYTLEGDLYMFTVPSGTNSTFDKIIFSNGNDTTSITNATIPADYSANKLYAITDGTGKNQVATISKDFNVNLATNINKFSTLLLNNNQNANKEITDSLDLLAFTVQKILASLDSYDLFNDLLKPLDDLNVELKKDDTSIDNLKDKIDEGKDTIKDGGYTIDSTTQLEEDIDKAQNIVDNNQYFTNDQINDMTDKLDKDIQSLIPDTSELEKLLEEAKKIEQSKYTEETSKVLADSILNAETALSDKSNLTILKISELTKNLRDAISGLKEKTILTENTNPSTGDILYIVIPLLIISALAIAFTTVYSKKKKQNQNN